MGIELGGGLVLLRGGFRVMLDKFKIPAQAVPIQGIAGLQARGSIQTL